jgi:hypothetical protein
MSRIPADATAFGDRPQILLGYEANFEERDAADANVAWVRNSIEELKPYSTGGAYLNFPASSRRATPSCAPRSATRTTGAWSRSRPSTIRPISSA